MRTPSEDHVREYSESEDKLVVVLQMDSRLSIRIWWMGEGLVEEVHRWDGRTTAELCVPSSFTY